MKILLVLAVVLVGCAPASRVVLPRTPEAMACYRECMAMSRACFADARMQIAYGANPWIARAGCNRQDSNCLASCPGACTEMNGGCFDLAGQNLYSPAPQGEQAGYGL